MTVKEQISGSDARCEEREVNRGLKKQRDRKKDKTERRGDMENQLNSKLEKVKIKDYE